MQTLKIFLESILVALAVIVAYKRHGNLKGVGTNRRYEGIRRSGRSKTVAAKIANAGKTHVARSRMARKAWRTRKRRYGKSGRR